jgi:hypothetical protein
MTLGCNVSCFIGVMFLVANIYVTLGTDKNIQKSVFYQTLDKVQIQKYEEIIKERRDIYMKGYGLGLFISFLILVLHYYMKSPFIKLRKSLICFIGGITLTVNYFYYMLTPKSDYMIRYLDKANQREEWLKINKSMQFKYHIGLGMGIIAAMFLSESALSLC